MKSILYNTQTNETISDILPDLYSKLFPQGILKQHEVNLIVVNLPTPEHDTTTHKAIPLPYVANIEARTYTREWDIVPLTEQELATREWVYPEYEKRITAPKMLTIQFAGVLKWFEIENLPFKSDDNFIYLWCKFIRPEHQSLIDAANSQLEGTGLSIIIEDRPQIFNSEIQE